MSLLSEHRMTRMVEFSDTDLAGIVHFSTWFRYMEAAEHAFWRAAGFSVHGKKEADGSLVTFPRVHAEADYRRPLLFEQTIETQLLVRSIRSRSITFDFLVRRESEAEPAGRGRIVVASVRKLPDGSLRGIEVPQTVRNRIGTADADALAVWDQPNQPRKR